MIEGSIADFAIMITQKTEIFEIRLDKLLSKITTYDKVRKEQGPLDNLQICLSRALSNLDHCAESLTQIENLFGEFTAKESNANQIKG